MDLEEKSLDPVIERECAECGAKLTSEEIQASLDAGGPYLARSMRPSRSRSRTRKTLRG